MPTATFDVDNSLSDQIVLAEQVSRNVFRFAKTSDGTHIDLSKPDVIEPNPDSASGHEFYRLAAVQTARHILASS